MQSLYHTQLSVKRVIRIYFVCTTRKKQNYIHLFNTVLYIVRSERPFSDLSELINLQRTNGIKFEDGKTNNKVCVEFILYMSDVMRDDITAILENLNFFAAAEDGSQVRKTQFEKELLYVKTVIRGKPGGASAEVYSYGRLWKRCRRLKTCI